MSTSTAAQPREHYQEWRGCADAAAESAIRRADGVARLRLLAFLLLVLGFVWAELAAPAGGSAGASALAIVAAAAFVGLVGYHRWLRGRLRRHRAEQGLAAEGLARLDRKWDALATHAEPAAPPDHPYAADLDIFGHASLWRLVGPTATPSGTATVASWLLTPADADEVAARQAAVRDLAGATELRARLAIAGRLAPELREDRVAAFLEWTRAEPWLLRHRAMVWLARLLPIATIGFAALDLAGGGMHFWLATLALSLLLLARLNGPLARIRSGAAPADSLDAHVDVLELVEAAPFRSAKLLELQGRLRAGSGRSASAALRRLARLLHLADLRLSMLHFAVNLVTLWDVHIAWMLERWRQRNGRSVSDWLIEAGEIDALAAIGTLAFEAPGWRYARVRAGVAQLTARELGHPLLHGDQVVRNDVVVGPAGTALFVTGSNMSGKSTLLRAIGANVVLSQCGAPSCAAELEMPPLRPFTSMRVRDSLERGISFFMAEVDRLRRLVGAAERDVPPGPVLYLLDEILQGTNTEEHRIGACWVLGRLLATKAIGALATHDISLPDEPTLSAALRPVHFRETVIETDGAGTMEFDYRLRSGVATSRNALRIMRLAGLGGE